MSIMLPIAVGTIVGISMGMFAIWLKKWLRQREDDHIRLLAVQEFIAIQNRKKGE